jgi:hypothetical protein
VLTGEERPYEQGQVGTSCQLSGGSVGAAGTGVVVVDIVMRTRPLEAHRSWLRGVSCKLLADERKRECLILRRGSIHIVDVQVVA